MNVGIRKPSDCQAAAKKAIPNWLGLNQVKNQEGDIACMSKVCCHDTIGSHIDCHWVGSRYGLPLLLPQRWGWGRRGRNDLHTLLISESAERA